MVWTAHSNVIEERPALQADFSVTIYRRAPQERPHSLVANFVSPAALPAACYALLPSCCSALAMATSHRSRAGVHSSYMGVRSVGASSSAPARISTSFALSTTPNTDEPHVGQKWRSSVVSFQLWVLPAIEIWSAFQTAKKLPTEPVSLRHTRQWQKPTRTGGPLTSKLT